MRRREFIMSVSGAIATHVLPASAQEAGRTYRVGMLFPFPRDRREGLEAITAFSNALRKEGFIEGQNVWRTHDVEMPNPK